MKIDLLEELLSIILRQGRLQRRDGVALLLGKRQSRQIGDENLVLSVTASKHLLSKLTLYLSWEWVSGPKITQQVTTHSPSPQAELTPCRDAEELR